ncbi:ABC transporter ATP-binding protein [Thalassococcus sp. S3]|nr:ABC transporter ATP-binding protein [Thalassococcus sp. S3]
MRTVPDADNVIEAGFARPLLETRGLCYLHRGVSLLQGVSVRIRPGRRTVILGPNGAGKSLLVRLMHGLLPPSAGQILWDGALMSASARTAQALVFQRPVMLRRSVLANLRFALAARGVGGRERTRLSLEALALAQLETLAHRPARVLSGGEQQRLAVARALVCKPRLLLLDEPTSSLDPASTAHIETLINRAHESGVTVVMVTHDQGQARRLADDVIFVQGGHVAETGPATQVLNAPNAPATRAWLKGELYLADLPPGPR